MSGDSDRAVDAALAHHRAGRLVEAESIYLEILAAAPRQVSALHGLALVLADAGLLAEGRQLLDRAATLAPEDAGLANSLGLLAMRGGDSLAALAAFDRVLALDTGFDEARVNRGLALLAAGRRAEARGALEAALERDPRHVMALAALG
ncbi:MAG: tetratricopeptide repeat protein, partial [Alphaproteobacteria bacterium]|nr:tetratricopeptide repeat protein [Alphaproteobacteria bacterium]